MSDPNDVHPSSDLQQEVARRRRCYQEALVRHLYLRTDSFEREHGWVDQNGYPTAKKMWYVGRPGDGASEAEKNAWNALPAEQQFGHDLVMAIEGNTTPIYTVCDVLDYQAAPGVPCDRLTDHAVVPVNPDGTGPHDFFQSIARLDLAQADPSRQKELFGWTTPEPADRPAVNAFEKSKTLFWGHVCHSAFFHLETLKDTADFKACELIRLLYLAGEIPPHLRSTAPWRRDDDLSRNINFSPEIEAHIARALLEFKFWVDDPFFVNGAFNATDRELMVKAIRRGREMQKKPPPSPADVEKVVNEEIEDDDIPEEMTFWSENHQILFASAEYLAGQWLRDDVFRAGLPNRAEGPTGTRPGDLTGEQRMRHAKPRLLRWLADRMRLGFSEWNALPYYEEDIEPLLNLVDFCLDEEIRSRAEIVLDLVLFDLARFAHNGNFSPASGRCYANQKMCGYEPGIGDLVEILFGTRGGVIVWSDATAAGTFASSRRYIVPDALIRIGQDRPRRIVDRSRVSLRFDEAAPYGAGFQTIDDAMFWWSRSSYITKEVVRCTKRQASNHHLAESGPFLALLPLLGTIKTLAKPLTLLTSDPGEVDVVDTLSPLTEGSALTRANLYTYRNRHAMLSSVQNFRRGQFNAQSHVCQATLSPGATVWTTHPSAGATLSGVLAGAVAGGLLAGPVGAWAGGFIGMLAAPGGIEIIPAGADGPNWWTGSASLPRVIQREGAAIIAYQPGELLRRLLGDKTHAWFPRRAFDEGSVVQRRSSNCNISSARWTFGKVGDGYVGLLSAREVTWTTVGPWADKELVADEGRNIFIIQVGNVDEFGSYDGFKDQLSKARVHINGLRLMTADFQCSYDLPGPAGGRLEVHVDDDEVRYNGARFSDDHFPRFETPYVKCGRVAWGQYHYTIALGGDTLTHDFSELKTKAEGAAVRREMGGAGRDCELDRFWVVSNRGARRTFPENTIEACRHAVEQENAMGLLVDACLTRDGEVVLWHDWNPDDVSAMLRRTGIADAGAYRPVVPDVDDPLRDETIRLTLAQLRFGYGYALGSAPSGSGPAPFVVPTLGELVSHAWEWSGLRHLLINVAMPARHAAEFGGDMVRGILTAIGVGLGFDVILVAEDDVLMAMKAYAADAVTPTAIKFSSRTIPSAVPATADGSPDHAAGDAALRSTSAIEAAIRHRTAVALIDRGLLAVGAFDNDYYRFVGYDIGRMEAFNLNPHQNSGHQVERLLGRVTDDPLEMQVLLEMGLSGIVTDDVPALREVVAKGGRI